MGKVIVPKKDVFFFLFIGYFYTDVCFGNTCQNGDCVPTSASTYECQCEEGWFGTNCDVCKWVTLLKSTKSIAFI